MRALLSILRYLLVFSVAGIAQQPHDPAPPPCQPGRPVDDYIKELKKRKRNKNPLPGDVCLFGSCTRTGAGQPGPGKPPTSHPPETPAPDRRATPAKGESSSKDAIIAPPVAGLADSRYDPIGAAKAAEVGDYYFQGKNYRAARSRYEEALEMKPADPALYFRLGKTFEKLNEFERAFENYDATLIADPQAPDAREAAAGIERLRPALQQRGFDAVAAHAANVVEVAAACRQVPPAAGR